MLWSDWKVALLSFRTELMNQVHFSTTAALSLYHSRANENSLKMLEALPPRRAFKISWWVLSNRWHTYECHMHIYVFVCILQLWPRRLAFIGNKHDVNNKLITLTFAAISLLTHSFVSLSIDKEEVNVRSTNLKSIISGA